MGVITFNSLSSQPLGIQVEHPPEYETPERNYDVQSIPGRNGDVVQDTGSYKNVPRKYAIAIGSLEKEYAVMANTISQWLHSGSGYCRLEDSYEPDYFRMAMYSEGNSLSNLCQHAGRETISFNCKPQRFLKTGEDVIKPKTNTAITNPTDQIALPLIRVKGTGSGTLRVGNYTAMFTGIQGYIDLDSDIQDAYNLDTNMNEFVTLLDKLYPKLLPGDSCLITFSGGITSVEVTPRWWTI